MTLREYIEEQDRNMQLYRVLLPLSGEDPATRQSIEELRRKMTALRKHMMESGDFAEEFPERNFNP